MGVKRLLADRRLFLVGAVLAVLGALLWWQYRPAPGVETMSDADPTLAMLGLVSSIAGLAASVTSLIATILQIRDRK